MRRPLTALVGALRAPRHRTRSDRGYRLGRTRPQLRHEAQPRRVLHPTRGVRQAHPAVPEDPAGDGVSFSQSYGASGEQTRAVKAGLDADIVDAVARARHGRARRRGEGRREVEEAVVQGDGHGLRRRLRRSRRQPEEDQELERPPAPRRRQVVTPNPFTSGGARWNVMAAYGSWRKQGKTDKQAQANLLKMWRNVVVQDTSARAR